MNTPLVLVSWDGVLPPLQSLLLDADPRFELVLFDYSGVAVAPRADIPFDFSFLSEKTECKGDIFSAFARHLKHVPNKPSHVALIDDDVMIGMSDINRAMLIGRQRGLDAFSPALSHESYFSHDWSLSLSRRMVREVDWVEVMMPFYDFTLFEAASAYFGEFVSSWGFDCYLFPAVQKIIGKDKTAILDFVIATHQRPISSMGRKFRNGLYAFEEADEVKKLSMDLLRVHRPELLQSDWYKRIYVDLFEPKPTADRVASRLRKQARRWLDPHG